MKTESWGAEEMSDDEVDHFRREHPGTLEWNDAIAEAWRTGRLVRETSDIPN